MMAKTGDSSLPVYYFAGESSILTLFIFSDK